MALAAFLRIFIFIVSWNTIACWIYWNILTIKRTITTKTIIFFSSRKSDMNNGNSGKCLYYLYTYYYLSISIEIFKYYSLLALIRFINHTNHTMYIINIQLMQCKWHLKKKIMYPYSFFFSQGFYTLYIFDSN